MKSEHLVGTSIPRFTFDTPTTPGNDFYKLCEGEHPLVMIFLPAFDHPVTREYLTRYLQTLPRLRGVRLACVVRSSPRMVAKATQGAEFPFTLICDAPGVLYGYLGVEQARGILSWSFAAQRIYKAAKEQGYRYNSNAPQQLPLTLVVGHMGKILFTHSGRSQTDLPEDCAAIREITREVVRTMAEDQRRAHPHCSDETLTLPDLVGWDDLDGNSHRVNKQKHLQLVLQVLLFLHDFSAFRGTIVRKKPRDAAQGCDAHQREHDARPDGCAAAQQPAHKIELEQPHKAPVDAAHDH